MLVKYKLSNLLFFLVKASVKIQSILLQNCCKCILLSVLVGSKQNVDWAKSPTKLNHSGWNWVDNWNPNYIPCHFFSISLSIYDYKIKRTITNVIVLFMVEDRRFGLLTPCVQSGNKLFLGFFSFYHNLSELLFCLRFTLICIFNSC